PPPVETWGYPRRRNHGRKKSSILFCLNVSAGQELVRPLIYTCRLRNNGLPISINITPLTHIFLRSRAHLFGEIRTSRISINAREIRTIVVVTCLCRRERPLCKHRYPIYRWHTILRRIVIQIIRDILPAILAHLKLIYTHLDKLGIHSL